MTNKVILPKRIRQYTMLNGRRLEILWLDEFDGLATQEHSGIALNPKLCPSRFWQVAIHEIIHQCNMERPEADVDTEAEEIERFIRTLGRKL